MGAVELPEELEFRLKSEHGQVIRIALPLGDRKQMGNGIIKEILTRGLTEV